MVLNMGPQHPATHGVLRLVVEIDGEVIVSVRPEIGYLHTGIEKTCEAKFYQQVVPLTDRINYLDPLSNNLCYCLAVEKLLDLEIPERAQWIRVLLTELSRLNSHLIWLGTHAMDIGALTVFLYTFREREEILRLFEAVAGQRMMTSYFRIGGLAMEPPLDFFDRVQAFITTFPRKIDEYSNLLTGNPIFMNRLKGVGYLSAADAIALGVTGPPLRASGVDIDLRRDMPYSSYEKFQFKVPTSTVGDIWARYEVRLVEMRESIKIIQQALDGMPGGPVKADAPKIVLPDREKMKTADGSADPSLQNRHRGLRCSRRRGLSGHRMRPRADGLLRRLRRHRQALPRAHALSVVRHAAGSRNHVQRPPDRRPGRRHRLHRHCSGRDRPLTCQRRVSSASDSALGQNFGHRLASLLRSYTAAHGLTRNRAGRQSS